MTYTQLENSGLIVPEGTLPTKEFWRVMGKHSRQIVCVDKIDPDVTLHPTGIEWDVNGVHKGLPFFKGAGIHSLDEVTRIDRENQEIAETALAKRPEKERKRKDQEAHQKDRDDFELTPVGERKAIYDMKVSEEIEVAQADITKAKRGRKKK